MSQPVLLRRVTLLRPAQAEAPRAGGSDRERQLDRRGLVDAGEMAQCLVANGLIPDRILASPAVRTRQTAEAILRNLALERAVLMFDESLYLAEADRILAVIMSMPADVEHLLVVGHNPGLSELAGGLAPGVAPRDLHTAGALTLRYKNVQGSDLRSDHVEQAQYYSPGQLGYA